MVPFIKSSGDIKARKAQSLADYARMHHFAPANDDNHNMADYRAPESFAMNK